MNIMDFPQQEFTMSKMYDTDNFQYTMNMQHIFKKIQCQEIAVKDRFVKL